MPLVSRKCPNPACGVPVNEGQNFCHECSVEIPDTPDEKRCLSTPEEILDNVLLEYSMLPLGAGCHGTIPLRFTNRQNEQPITSLKFTLTSTLCQNPEETERTIERDTWLTPGKTARLSGYDFDIPTREGSYSLEIYGHFLVNAEIPVAFHASATIFVLGKKIGGMTIKVADGGALNAEHLTAGIIDSIEVEGGGAMNLKGLLQDGQQQGQWHPLTLEFAPDKTRLLEDFLGKQKGVEASELPEHQSDLKSRAVWRVEADKGKSRMIQIFTGDTFTMGRSAEQVDLVTTLLPATEENIEKTNHISAKHCAISIRQGNNVFITDCKSKNGIVAQGKKITGPYKLSNKSRIVLANTFRLDFCEYRELSAIREVREIRQNSNITINEFSTQIGNLPLEELRLDVPLDCFTLTRCDDFRDKLQYLFLRRFADIGSSFSNGLYINHRSVAKKHARLILMENGYHLEALDRQRVTLIEDKRLYPGRPKLLPANRPVKLCFGEVTVIFNAAISLDQE